MTRGDSGALQTPRGDSGALQTPRGDSRALQRPRGDSRAVRTPHALRQTLRAIARAALLAALAHALLPALARAEPTLDVDLPAAPVHVGDRVTVTLTLTAPGALADAPRFPAWGTGWGDAEIVSAGKVEDAGSGVFRQQLVLAPFSTGDVALPPQTVEVPFATGTVHLQTPAAALHVASLLPPKESKAEARPPAPPQALPLGDRFWWTLGAGGALCLLAGGLLFFRVRDAASTGGAAGRGQTESTPLAELERELDALAALGPALASEPAHTRLSLAARRFLGRSFGFHALESTTSEVRAALRERAVPREAASALVEVLRACDAVKFARQGASAEAAGQRLTSLRAAAATITHVLTPVHGPSESPTREARPGWKEPPQP